MIYTRYCINIIIVVVIIVVVVVVMFQWSKFLELGDSIDAKIVEDKITALNPSQCASLIYTVSVHVHVQCYGDVYMYM